MTRHTPIPPLPILPMLVAASGICTFAVMDAAMKRAALLVGVYTALLLRSLMASLLMAPLWRLTGGRWPAWPQLRIHALRGVVCTGMAGCFFWGLVRMPMAQAIALSFIAPLIALFLAAVVLKERIRAGAILASLLGLAGVLVIGLARLHEASGGGAGAGGRSAIWGMGAVLVSALLYAWNLMIQRQQARVSGPVEVALFQSLVIGLSLALLSPWAADWRGGALPWVALAYIAGAAVLTMISLMLLSWAWGRAEAQVLLPLEYTAFIWSALMGWLMFGERLRLPTLIGAALIVTGCWIATRASGRPPAKPGALPAHIEQTAL